MLRTMGMAIAVPLLALAGGCPEPPGPVDAGSDDAPSDQGDDGDAALSGETPVDAEDAQVDGAPPSSHTLTVTVTLDDSPEADALVVQGGTSNTWRTGADGTVSVQVDMTVEGEVALVASHREARSWSEQIWRNSPADAVIIALRRYDPADNPEYTFQDPGEPGASPTTGQCGHCHVTINEAWYASEHRTSASNPRLYDLYTGRAANAVTPADCADVSGVWTDGQEPGSDTTAAACFSGPSALADMNNGCTPGTDCETSATQFGGCADCHAPGINGKLGGRDLLAARGFAYDYGVHCDVCHKVESVDLSAEAGVAGRLGILRPSEPGSLSLGPFKPLQFGPNPDVPNIRMGNVPREHFHTADLCAGCHELDQPVLVAGASIDLARWPSGRLPIHSTYSEWQAGPMNPGAPCQSCHMPPDPDVLNSADLQLFEGASIGIVGGWKRPPGAVRKHVWIGPRADGSGMLENAAALFVDVALVGDEVTATVTTKNVGPGHAIPTGEPMRSLVLTVQAHCANTALVPASGDAVPDYGGAVVTRDSAQDWTVWPEAAVGDVIRVVARAGTFNDYEGHGPFGDGTFSAVQKGLPVDSVVGETSVTAVGGDGTVTLDAPLPVGDIAYLTRGPTDFAGLPGMAFARVLVGADGERMVAHHAAVDVASDNRLLPQKAWTSSHTFTSTCDDPTVTARLVHVDVPARLSRLKGWVRTARPMAEVTR